MSWTQAWTLSGTSASASVQSSVALNNNEVDSAIHSIRLIPLKSLKVVINEKCCDAMIDSGAQIVLLNKSVLTDDVCTVGKIQVQGVFGDTVTADITPVNVKRCNDDTDDRCLCMLSKPMQIFCGLVDNIALPAEIADELLSLPLFT